MRTFGPRGGTVRVSIIQTSVHSLDPVVVAEHLANQTAAALRRPAAPPSNQARSSRLLLDGTGEVGAGVSLCWVRSRYHRGRVFFRAARSGTGRASVPRPAG